MKMAAELKKLLAYAGEKIRSFRDDERGEANIIAIILIIIVVISLAVIFRDQLTGIVNRLFGNINASIDDF